MTQADTFALVKVARVFMREREQEKIQGDKQTDRMSTIPPEEAGNGLSDCDQIISIGFSTHTLAT